jgi:hypothetical protein
MIGEMVTVDFRIIADIPIHERSEQERRPPEVLKGRNAHTERYVPNLETLNFPRGTRVVSLP